MIGDWDWGFEIVLFVLRLGIGIRDWDCRLGQGIADWGFGNRMGDQIWDRGFGLWIVDLAQGFRLGIRDWIEIGHYNWDLGLERGIYV